MPVTAPDPGVDFALIVDNLESVTVTQINPDTGASVTSSSTVTAFRRAPFRHPVNVGFGGALGFEEMRWILLASDVSFVPRARDSITDSSNVVWDVNQVHVNATATLYFCDCNRSR